MLTKHCLQEFILDCQLRRLSPRTVKGYHNNTHNFLIYSEKHYEITEVEEIRTVHIKQYIQYLLNKKLTASYINGILKCLRAFFHFTVQEEYIYANPTDKVRMQKIDMRTYTQRVFSMYGGEQKRVSMRFINPLLDTVIERFGTGAEVFYRRADDTHFIVSADVEISDQFYGWICGFRKKAVIVSPPDVVADFQKFLGDIQGRYQSE